MPHTNAIDGGTNTARVSAAATDADARIREQVRADAAAYLRRTGNEDLLPILGLTVIGGGCEWCGKPVLRTSGTVKKRFCDTSCYADARVAATAKRKASRG